MATKRRAGADDEEAVLFRLPLSEFTAARNALATRLKKAGRTIDAERVKSLAKPPATAWVVNQLYWENPQAIGQLVVVAERTRKAQTGQLKNADLRELLNEKKRLMAELVGRAAMMLRAAGHGASPDAIRRVSATLESLAVWGNAEGVPKAGRLTADLDPPGFEAFAALMGGAKFESAKVLPFRAARPIPDPAAARARAREAMQAATKVLRDAQREEERAQTALTKANAHVVAIEKERQELEARHAEAKDEARVASNEARKAAQAVAEAERALAKAKAALE